MTSSESVNDPMSIADSELAFFLKITTYHKIIMLCEKRFIPAVRTEAYLSVPVKIHKISHQNKSHPVAVL